VAESQTTRYQLRDKVIVEVGCGKGEFLRLLCKGGKNLGVGYDPSYVGPDTAEGGAVRFVRAFYDSQQAEQTPDFVCCRHVIEHVRSPLEMLRAIRQAIGDKTSSRVYFETPDLQWILDTGTFWDFFYEHCSYFTAESLTWAFQQAGFQVTSALSAFDGQYLCLEAKPALSGTPGRVSSPPYISSLRSKIQCLVEGLRERMEACKEQIQVFRKAGGCALWGAAAKGVTLANTVDPEGRYIRCLVDLNPAKQEKFVPGTGHQIVLPERLKDRHKDIAGILNMNPNYLEENRSILAQMSLKIPIVSL